MDGKTHVACGVATATAITSLTGLFGADTTGILTFSGWVIGASFGAMLPDVDLPESKINGIFPFALISFIIRHIGRVKHRGVTHSILFLVGLSMIAGILIATRIPMLIGFGAGMILGDMTHLLLDILNGKGCQLFYPLPVRFHIADVKYEGLVEWIIRSVGSIIFVASLVTVFR